MATLPPLRSDTPSPIGITLSASGEATGASSGLVRLCAAGFVAYCSYAICRSPLLPLFARDLGAGPSTIDIVVGASTIYQISVSTAFRAQTFAIFPAKNLIGQGQHYLLANNLGNVDRAALHERLVQFVNADLGFASPNFFRCIYENIIERNVNVFRNRIKTSRAVQQNIGVYFSSNMRLADDKLSFAGE